MDKARERSIVGVSSFFFFVGCERSLLSPYIKVVELNINTYIADFGVLVLGQMYSAKGTLANDTLQDVLLQLLVALSVLGQGGVQGLFDLDMARELRGAPARCRGGCGE